MAPRSLIFYHSPHPTALGSGCLLLHGRRALQLVQRFFVLAERKPMLLLGRRLLWWAVGGLLVGLLVPALLVLLLVWALLVLILLVLALILLVLLLVLLILVLIAFFGLPAIGGRRLIR